MGSLFSTSSSPSAPPAAAADATKPESRWGGLFGGAAPEPEPEAPGASLSSLLSSPSSAQQPPPPENETRQGWGLFGAAPEPVPEPEPSRLSALLSSPPKEEPTPNSDQEGPGFVGSLFCGAAAPEPENDPPPASGGWGLFASSETAPTSSDETTPTPSDEATPTPSDAQALSAAGDGNSQDSCFLLCSSSGASEEREHVARMRRYYRIWSDAVASQDPTKMDELLPLLADVSAARPITLLCSFRGARSITLVVWHRTSSSSWSQWPRRRRSQSALRGGASRRRTRRSASLRRRARRRTLSRG